MSFEFHQQLLDDLKTYQTQIVEGYTLPFEYAQWYFDRRIFPYLDRPRFMGPKDPDRFYRGMYLSLDAFENILRNGLTVDRVSWTAYTGRAISFSSNIEEAKTYIFHNADQRNMAGLGVVLEVSAHPNIKPIEISPGNPNGTIYSSNRNIAPENITHIYLVGQYGLEDFDHILERAKSGTIVPHSQWTKVLRANFGR